MMGLKNTTYICIDHTNMAYVTITVGYKQTTYTGTFGYDEITIMGRWNDFMTEVWVERQIKNERLKIMTGYENKTCH